MQQPSVQEVNGRALGGESLAPKHARVVISDQTIAGLAVEASKATHTAGVSGRLLHNKTKVNGDALSHFSGAMTGFLRVMGMMQLCSLAHRAVGQIIGSGKHWRANGLLAGLTHMLIAHVTHALMPQKEGLLARQVT